MSVGEYVCTLEGGGRRVREKEGANTVFTGLILNQEGRYTDAMWCIV